MSVILRLTLAMLSLLGSLRLASSSSSASSLPRRLPTLRSKKSAELLSEEASRAARFIQFVDSSPEPFHVTATVAARLRAAGFVALNEADLWRANGSIRQGGKYYFTRNGSSLLAFCVGEKFVAGNGFKVLGAHTDSPNLKLKPRSKRSSSGLVQVAVECYGGGLWNTWFDRDLSVAGRVIVRRADGFDHKLVKISRPILRVPSLCIHLRTPEEREQNKINKEEHLVPILCEEVQKSLSSSTTTAEKTSSAGEDGEGGGGGGEGGEGGGGESEKSTTEAPESDQWACEQTPELLTLLSKELGCAENDIVDFELSLFDTQGAATGGLNEEFVCGSRIDNLASCFVAVEALEAHASTHLSDDEDCTIVALFDHEEVGSGSNPGAGSTLMRDAVSRISNALCSGDAPEDSELFKAGLARSLIFSVDMAHAIHPNYASKHEKGHAPKMNAGVVIKSNSNQRYATNGVTGFFVRELARRNALPIQEFAVRNDCPCGSTIGPIISQNTGIRAVDLGMPQLSMHSIRETMGTSDLTFAFKLFSAFFKDFRALDSSHSIDQHPPAQ